jgi:hypothetical protein
VLLADLPSASTQSFAVSRTTRRLVPDASSSSSSSSSSRAAELSSSATLPIPDGFLTIGLYHITVGLGTPPVSMRVHLDTGSATLGVYSSACSACVAAAARTPPGDAARVYSPSASRTSSPVFCSDSACAAAFVNEAAYPKCIIAENCSSQCTFTVNYGDASFIRGAVTRDVLTLGNASAYVTFGRISAAKAVGACAPLPLKHLPVLIFSMAVYHVTAGGGAGLFEPAGTNCARSFDFTLSLHVVLLTSLFLAFFVCPRRH